MMWWDMAEEWPQQLEWQSWHWPCQAARMSFVSHCLCSLCSSRSKIGWAASLVVYVCSLLSQLSECYLLQHESQRELWRLKYHHLCCPVFIEVMAQGHCFNDAQIFLISLLSYFLHLCILFVILQERNLAFFPFPKGCWFLLRKVWDHRGC